jgi:hypothetical protein
MTPLADGETLAEDWTYYDDIYVKCSFELDLDTPCNDCGFASARLRGSHHRPILGHAAHHDDRTFTTFAVGANRST